MIAESKLWVVEIMFEERDKWESTVGVALTRVDGRRVLEHWRGADPSDKFRLVKYERTPSNT